MKIKIEGGPDDLIRRLDSCNYCVFEEILTPEQRKIKVLDKEIPERHVHRLTIEQLCARGYDMVCPLKYVVMRMSCDDFTAVQVGNIMIFLWDLGKKFNRRFNYDEGVREWTKEQDLGRGKKESYAGRFKDVWNLGLRKDYDGKDNSILDTRFIYELVVSSPKNYIAGINVLEKLKQEHEKRATI